MALIISSASNMNIYKKKQESGKRCDRVRSDISMKVKSQWIKTFFLSRLTSFRDMMAEGHVTNFRSCKNKTSLGVS